MRILVASLFALSAGVALAGGGGEELPIAAPVVAPVVMGPVLNCEEPGVAYNDRPSVLEYFAPETSWSYKEWQWVDGGFNWVTVVMETPDSRCNNYWEDYNRANQQTGNNEHDGREPARHGVTRL